MTHKQTCITYVSEIMYSFLVVNFLQAAMKEIQGAGLFSKPS